MYKTYTDQCSVWIVKFLCDCNVFVASGSQTDGKGKTQTATPSTAVSSKPSWAWVTSTETYSNTDWSAVQRTWERAWPQHKWCGQEPSRRYRGRKWIWYF